MSIGPGLVLAAGTVTFGNEWIQTSKMNWRVPVATLLGAWMFAGIDKISDKASAGLGVMVLLAALATPLNGKSPIQEIQSLTTAKKKGK